MFYIVPIEPLEERYTEQWYRWIPAELDRRGIEHHTIDGDSLANTVEVGTFLDINSTLNYKAEQLKKIAQLFYKKQIRNGDIFFVSDIEFWGIESIKYLADLNGIKVKLFGYCHAASYTKEDFIAKCEPYAKYFERGWFKVFDKIFVGTEYHKRQILKHNRCSEADKIVVEGNFYNVKEVKQQVSKYTKKKQVILTNRPDYEKRPNLTLDVFKILKDRHPDWEFVATTSRKQWGSGWIRALAKAMEQDGVLSIKEGLSKKEYLTCLAESRVMTGNTIEENFGYCILEAMVFNTVPVVEDKYSHPELLKGYPQLLYKDIGEQICLIEDNFDKNYDFSLPLKRYEEALQNIIDVCLN